MTIQKTLLLVDLSNQIHKSIHIHRGLMSHDGTFTGGFYGVLQQLSHLVNAYQPFGLVICEDRKPYIRATEYASRGEYKAGRQDATADLTEEEREKKRVKELCVQQSVQLLYEFFDTFKVPRIYREGLEADDWIAYFTDYYVSSVDKVVVVSTDTDLYQLLEYPNVVIHKKKDVVYDREKFMEEWGCDPKIWRKVTAMAGTHNAVSGISKVGEKTAIKYITKGGPKALKVMDDNAQLIEENLKLIELPHATLDDEDLGETFNVRMDPFVERDMLKFLGKYDVTFTPVMQSAFEWLTDRSRKHF